MSVINFFVHVIVFVVLLSFTFGIEGRKPENPWRRDLFHTKRYRNEKSPSPTRVGIRTTALSSCRGNRHSVKPHDLTIVPPAAPIRPLLFGPSGGLLSEVSLYLNIKHFLSGNRPLYFLHHRTLNKKLQCHCQWNPLIRTT